MLCLTGPTSPVKTATQPGFWYLFLEDVDEAGMFANPGRWQVWSLAVPATCRNCGVDGLHDLTVSCRNITVRCRNCRFTHVYRFNLEYMAEDTSGGKTAGVVSGHATCP